ncbi:hypothetical protein KAM339_002710 [Aeromonas caviae]|nr:hypothetical protein KAM339_002710 [Aeromonas caviae]
MSFGGDQGLIDDDGLKLALRLFHNQGAFVRAAQRRFGLGGGGISRGNIGDRRGNSGGLRLDYRRGSVGRLRWNGLSLFFLAAETQPGKQTFCHLKILTSKADC